MTHMMHMSCTAIVLAGGDPVEPRVGAQLPLDALVVAADSGVHHAEALGLRVDIVVGDLDSADPAAVERARAAGAVVERHPADKDATDLELALDAARGRGARHITVVGIGGGRLDHLLANFALLGSPRYADVEIDARTGDAYVAVIRGGRPPRTLLGAAGSLVTLLPVGGDATGITTSGLQYALSGATLTAGTSQGVSNVLTGDPASVGLEHGTLLAVQVVSDPTAGSPAEGAR